MLEALILGLVQGLTEFLPVSSSAHLRIAGIFLPGGADPGAAFTAIIQLGTEAAVLVYFRRDIVRLVRALVLGLLRRDARADPAFREAWLIVVGSIPIVVLGLALQKLIENQFRSLWIVAIDLIVFGVLLGVADELGAKRKGLDQLTVRDGIVYGLAQSLALVPGVSRSGGTIGAGLLLGYTREAAARYSFLLALPAVFGSGLYELAKSVHTPGYFGAAETLAATVVAFAVGLVVIAFFLRYLARGSFLPFVAYRVLIGLAVIGLLLSGIAKP